MRRVPLDLGVLLAVVRAEVGPDRRRRRQHESGIGEFVGSGIVGDDGAVLDPEEWQARAGNDACVVDTERFSFARVVPPFRGNNDPCRSLLFDGNGDVRFSALRAMPRVVTLVLFVNDVWAAARVDELLVRLESGVLVEIKPGAVDAVEAALADG